jgi:hypothetical protein
MERAPLLSAISKEEKWKSKKRGEQEKGEQTNEKK